MSAADVEGRSGAQGERGGKDRFTCYVDKSGLMKSGGDSVVQLADIERIALGVENLSTVEHEVLQRFTLLWTLFEAQILVSNVSVKKISEKVESIEP